MATIPEEATTGVIIAAAREEAPDPPIIVRAATAAGVERLASLDLVGLVGDEDQLKAAQKVLAGAGE